VDPLLANTILNHATALESTLRAAGQMQALPRSFSEAFFLSRIKDMEARIATLINQKVGALPGVKKSNVEVTLHLANGKLTYTFAGTITHTMKVFTSTFTTTAKDTIRTANPPLKLDLAALSTIGLLGDARICFNLPPGLPAPAQCVMLSDLFQ
jgi:hypothetical protein